MVVVLTALALVACSPPPAPDDPLPREDTVDSSVVPPDTSVPDTATPTPPPGSLLQFASGRTPSNLLMISIDTLRTDHLDRTSLDRMPFLAARAQEGVSADDVLGCANWTLATTSCVMGGRSTTDLGDATGLFPDIGPRPVELADYPADQHFLADWLGDAGFYTMMVSANPLFSRAYAQARGFEVATRRADGSATWVSSTGREMLDNRLADGSISSGQPWYLHVHFYDPHRTYDPPEGYRDTFEALPPIPLDLGDADQHLQANRLIRGGTLSQAEIDLIVEHERARYEAETRYLDDTLAAWWAELDADGLLDDTLVVVWTDHGEQFWEHGTQLHGNHLYREEIGATFFVWSKDLQAATTDRPVAQVDIAPTVLDLFGVPIPPEVTGSRLDDIPDVRTRFSHTVGKLGPIAAAERGRWKIHWAFANPETTTEPLTALVAGRTAYDLSVDPGATQPVWDDTDPDLMALWDELKVEVQRMEPLMAALGFEVLWLD